MNDIVLTSKKIPEVNDPIDHASLWLWNSDTNTRGGQCRFEDGYFRKKFDNYDELDVYVRNLKSVTVSPLCMENRRRLTVAKITL